MTAELERRYRRALRWYPARWRERHEEVVVSTLLDGADAEARTAPARGELLNLATSGVATRASVMLPVGVRDTIATVALATGTVLAVVFFVVYSWSPWATASWFINSHPTFGPFLNPGPLVYGLWPLAFALFLLRRHNAMRWLLGLAALAAPLLRLANWLQGDVWNGPMSTTLGMLMLLALAALLGSPRRGGAMLLSLGFAAGVTGVIVHSSGSIAEYPVWERVFWMAHSSPIEWMVIWMFSAAVALGIARRPHEAIFAVALTAPWALVVGLAAVRSDFWAAVGLALYGVLLVAAASLVALAIRRSRESPRQRA